MSALRELKILVFVVIVVGVLYWGVEPLAHSIFHPKTAPADFTFKDLPKMPTSTNVDNGKTLATTYCIACHSIEKEGFPATMDHATAAAAYGVVPPDLSNIGAIYDSNFLANLIKDPVKAVELTHKFSGDKVFPMAAIPISDQDIADVVAYFKSIGEKNLEAQVVESNEYKTKLDAINKKNAPNKDEEIAKLKEHLTDKEVFLSACNRCHSIKYDNVTAVTPDENLIAYMGTKVPDLSMMIRSRGEETLTKFINDPQKIIPNTSMPRVGLTEASQDRVIKYLSSVGDSKKEERALVGKILIGFMIIMTILAYLWKRKIWSRLH